MVSYVFGVEDLARTRFAISPAWELVRSLAALREPSLAALHVPWLRGLSGRLGGLDLRPAVALVRFPGYSPDFLTPPPSGPMGEIAEELAAIRATPAGEIRREMEMFRRSHREHALTQRWLDHPRRELGRLADMLEEFWERAHAATWPRVRALLEADIAHRAAQLVERGPGGLFSSLHHEVRWRSGRVEVLIAYEEQVELGGRGLLLMPSAFGSRGAHAITDAPWQPTVMYPARGLATLWEEEPAAPGGLAGVVGRTRAQLLVALAAPASTTDLARRLGVTPGAVSQHLAVLRAGGLVTSRRAGRSVLYVRTPTADALVR